MGQFVLLHLNVVDFTVAIKGVLHSEQPASLCGHRATVRLRLTDWGMYLTGTSLKSFTLQFLALWEKHFWCSQTSTMVSRWILHSIDLKTCGVQSKSSALHFTFLEKKAKFGTSFKNGQHFVLLSTMSSKCTNKGTAAPFNGSADGARGVNVSFPHF